MVLSERLASASVQGGYRAFKGLPLPTPDTDIVDADVVRTLPLRVERGHTYTVTVTLSVSSTQKPALGGHAGINVADDLPLGDGRGVRVRRARLLIGDDLAERVQLAHNDIKALDAEIDGIDAKLDEILEGQRSARALQHEAALRDCTKRVSLMLPEDHGGELEALERLVDERIATADDLGWDTRQARRHAATAHAHLEADRHRGSLLLALHGVPAPRTQRKRQQGEGLNPPPAPARLVGEPRDGRSGQPLG